MIGAHGEKLAQSCDRSICMLVRSHALKIKIGQCRYIGLAQRQRLGAAPNKAYISEFPIRREIDYQQHHNRFV